MSLTERIHEKLSAGFSPKELLVENESHLHNVPKGAETHFKVLVVADAFEGLGRVDRHRRVNEVLSDEFKAGLHALTIRALTVAEAEASGALGFVSPKCLGGSGS